VGIEEGEPSAHHSPRFRLEAISKMEGRETHRAIIFDDCILREAITHGLPVLDLRLICSKAEDYANEIEPGIAGGQKIAAGILNLMQNHDFLCSRTVSFS
jgi:hypothetical protein